jgi:hypothetical protein
MELPRGLHLTGKTNFMKHLNLSIAGVLCSLLLMNAQPMFSQVPVKEQIELAKNRPTYSHIVKGIIKDEAGTPMPGVNIYLKGTTEGTVTNSDGVFEFPRTLEAGERLTISFIGYESVEYLVQGNSDESIEISMKLNVIVIGDAGSDEVYTTKPTLRQRWSNFKKVF